MVVPNSFHFDCNWEPGGAKSNDVEFCAAAKGKRTKEKGGATPDRGDQMNNDYKKWLCENGVELVSKTEPGSKTPLWAWGGGLALFVSMAVKFLMSVMN